ncbi:MAG TPA: hypothetical protein VMO17_05690, partial [Terriglobia bacterium]|nr:hypothetical protein [Terriglobia bacterium]
TPAYIKIDVEGFEKRVLSGLSKAPAYVSFEVNTEYIEVAIDCVSSPCFSRAATFNIIIADAPRYELKDWVTKNRMVEILSSREIKCAETNGDLFVREG